MIKTAQEVREFGKVYNCLQNEFGSIQNIMCSILMTAMIGKDCLCLDGKYYTEDVLISIIGSFKEKGYKIMLTDNRELVIC